MPREPSMTIWTLSSMPSTWQPISSTAGAVNGSVSVEKFRYVIMHRLRVESGRQWVSVDQKIRHMCSRTLCELKVAVNRSASVEKFGICDYAPPENWKWSWMGQHQSRNSEYVITHPLILDSGRQWVSVDLKIRNMCSRTLWELKVAVNGSALIEKFGICDYAPAESWKWLSMGQRRSTNSEYVITHRLRVESERKWVSVGR